MSSTFWIASGIRWVALGALAALLGGVALQVTVLVGDSAELVAARRRLRSWSLVSGIALLVTTIAEFAIRLDTMTGGTPSEALLAIPAVLTRTHFGGIWIARVLMVLAAVMLCRRRSRGARLMALVTTAGVALTTSLTGHAARWGDFSPSVAADWAHVVASGISGSGACSD